MKKYNFWSNNWRIAATFAIAALIISLGFHAHAAWRAEQVRQAHISNIHIRLAIFHNQLLHTSNVVEQGGFEHSREWLWGDLRIHMELLRAHIWALILHDNDGVPPSNIWPLMDLQALIYEPQAAQPEDFREIAAIIRDQFESISVITDYDLANDPAMFPFGFGPNFSLSTMEITIRLLHPSQQGLWR